MSQIVAIDFDHTLFDTPNLVPMEGARDAISAFHERGISVMVHSCNNPHWIRKMCEEHDFRVDYIWGENGLDFGKPVAALYIDDRAMHFTSWREQTKEAIRRIMDRPMKGY